MKEIWQPVRVLIVDDHPVVRQGLSSLLAGHPDIEVVGEAEDGAQVLPLIPVLKPDIILLDIMLKEQSGIDAARRVRAAYPKVKIIILTTYGEEEYVHEALRVGVDGFLLKSISHETLPDSIRAVMAGEKLLSPPLVSTVVTNYSKLAQEQAKREAGLSVDDLQILNALAEGASSKDLAEQLFLSEATIKRRIQEILDKMNVMNRVQAIAEAVRRGWI
jgi:DNA-binding NarL/FixJ family response regulator